MSEEWGFAPPPFRVDEAQQRLRRDLREAGLTERGEAWERRGQALARIEREGDTLRLSMVREPARTPQWERRTLADNAALRDAVAELKRRLARWSDRDD